MPREYNLPTKEDYLLPGGHPDCVTFIVDNYNNIYPDIKWAERRYQYKQSRLDEYNQEQKQLVLFK